MRSVSKCGPDESAPSRRTRRDILRFCVEVPTPLKRRYSRAKCRPFLIASLRASPVFGEIGTIRMNRCPLDGGKVQALASFQDSLRSWWRGLGTNPLMPPPTNSITWLEWVFRLCSALCSKGVLVGRLVKPCAEAMKVRIGPTGLALELRDEFRRLLGESSDSKVDPVKGISEDFAGTR